MTPGIHNADAELCVCGVVLEGASGSLRGSADWKWGEKETEETDNSIVFGPAMEMLVLPFNRAMNLWEEQIQKGHPFRLGCDVSQKSMRCAGGAGDRRSRQSFKGVSSACAGHYVFTHKAQYSCAAST